MWFRACWRRRAASEALQAAREGARATDNRWHSRRSDSPRHCRQGSPAHGGLRRNRLVAAASRTNAFSRCPNEKSRPRRTGLFSQVISPRGRSGAPGTIRTSDPQIRSLMLYPAELRAPSGAAQIGQPWRVGNALFRNFVKIGAERLGEWIIERGHGQLNERFGGEPPDRVPFQARHFPLPPVRCVKENADAG